MISKRSIFWLLIILMPVLIAACSDTSSSVGQYHQGRILLLNILEIDRADELRYSTIDPSDVIRKWRIRPSGEGQELLLMRIRVENHIAVNAVFVADEQAVVVGGFFQDSYRPISVTGTVFLDQRGQTDASVSLVDGVCTDHARLVVNAGTDVRWTNDGETASAIQFDPGTPDTLGEDVLQIEPGGVLTHRFDRPGAFNYQCSGGDASPQAAQILVEAAESVRGKKENNILFLEGSFELPMDTSVDGWMIFELPKDTKIRDFRWRAGDSITIRF